MLPFCSSVTVDVMTAAALDFSALMASSIFASNRFRTDATSSALSPEIPAAGGLSRRALLVGDDSGPSAVGAADGSLRPAALNTPCKIVFPLVPSAGVDAATVRNRSSPSDAAGSRRWKPFDFVVVLLFY